MNAEVSPFQIRPLEIEDYCARHAIMICPGVQRRTLQLPSLTLATARERLGARSEGSHVLAALIDGRVVGQGWVQAPVGGVAMSASRVWPSTRPAGAAASTRRCCT